MLFLELRWGLLGLFAVIGVGTLGYRLIEGWPWLDALWMVVITLTTIGYGETHPLSDAGRLFTMAVILGGLGTVTFTLGRVTKYVIDGGLVEDLRTRRTRQKMQDLRDHYIVVGLGRLGREVVAELAHSGNKVVGVDPDLASLDACAELAVRIHGDGSDDAVLGNAAIERARGMAIATGSSATNVYVTLTARQLNPGLHILTRVEDETAGAKAIRAGADEVISPFGISGARMAQGLLRPHAANFVDLAIGRSFGEFALEDIPIGDAADYHGPLARLEVPRKHRVMIIAVRKKDGHLLTSIDKDTELAEGDVAVVIGKPADVGSFARATAGSGVETRTSRRLGRRTGR